MIHHYFLERTAKTRLLLAENRKGQSSKPWPSLKPKSQADDEPLVSIDQINHPVVFNKDVMLRVPAPFW
jgi:hypothetical protein